LGLNSGVAAAVFPWPTHFAMKVHHLIFATVLGAVGTAPTSSVSAAEVSTNRPARVQLGSFLPDLPISRARRPAPVTAILRHAGDTAAEVQFRLVLPRGVKSLGTHTEGTLRVEDGDDEKITWALEADEAASCNLALEIRQGAAIITNAALAMQFLPAVEMRKLPYLPEPAPVQTSLLIGAHHCPLWEADKFNMWANVLKHPERTPALGFYAQENPEVADWETTWAIEHGISFFVYCWYRTSQGGPVTTMFSSAIHDALFKSRFAGKMKFTIMWENQARGRAGVADERDLMVNLFPFWMENYFKHPSYLKIDNRPVLFIYRPEFLVQDLGNVENVQRAFGKMRQACRDNGFAGIYLLGEYRGLDPKHLALMKQLGLDYTFAYCWYIPSNPTPQKAIQTQMEYLKKTEALHVLPQVATVSQAWSGWADEGTIWKIPPPDYETLLRQARDFIATLPPSELGSKMLLLDNWNEWGEGHYIAPYREFGFGYLDAVRKVFARAPEPHTDLIPEDIGFGPYDTAYRAHVRAEEENRQLTSKKVVKAGAEEEGLIGWWAFDEETNSPVALDYSGHRLGGRLLQAIRAPGLDGNALVCQGGSVVVDAVPPLSLTALTIECWVKTGLAGQDNKWMVNRVFGGGESTGYRLGLLEGKPCFEVPATAWSHHLKASVPLPTNRWAHLAGTFDGRVMRMFVDGEERGSMDRPGPAKSNQFHLCLGNYEVKHPAHFTGLLDEVKLYNRAVTAEEVRVHFRRLAGR
jgi:hypothetical protein